MNVFRWILWVLTPRPRVRVVEIDGRTRLVKEEDRNEIRHL